MITATGNLVFIGLNTAAPQVFFNGTEVTGVTEIKTDWECDEQRITIKLHGDDDALYMQMVEAGINIRKDRRHV
jgi:hypothetical protein